MGRCYIQHTYSIQSIVFRKKYRTMERKKRSKGSVWEFCYANKIFGTFEEEIRACGQKWVTFCTHTHTHAAKLVVRMNIFCYCIHSACNINMAVERIIVTSHQQIVVHIQHSSLIKFPLFDKISPTPCNSEARKDDND